MRTHGGLKFALPVLSLTAAIAFFSGSALAQTHMQNGTVAPRGAPASVTSFGFGGHPGFHGVPASVTSQGFGANTAFRGPVLVNPGFGVRRPIHQRPGEFGHHHRVILSSPFYGGYYVPPYYDYSSSDYAEDDSISSEARAQRDYDARRQLENDYRTELDNSREQAPAPSAAVEQQPASDQPSTVLIFKDGHQVEVANYAIVGATLYDLSGGRSKKIQLAELDLPATVKENDQRGVEFQLPAQAKLN